MIFLQAVPANIFVIRYITHVAAMLDLCDLADGWQFIDGRCLKFFETPQSWYNARQTCQANQGDLTMYKNYDELRNIKSLMKYRTSDNMAWIGLSDTVCKFLPQILVKIFK